MVDIAIQIKNKPNFEDDMDWDWWELRINQQRYALIEPHYISLIGKETAELLTEFYSKFCSKYEFGINLFVAAIIEDWYQGYGILVEESHNEEIYNEYYDLLYGDLVDGTYEAERLANKIIRRVPQKMEVGYRWIY